MGGDGLAAVPGGSDELLAGVPWANQAADCDIFQAAFAFELIANLIATQFPCSDGEGEAK